MPIVIEPKDLNALIEKMHQSGIEGRSEAMNAMNQQIVGTSGAEAEKAKNDAAAAKSRGDLVDEQGVQPKQSFMARVFGGKSAGQAQQSPEKKPVASGRAGLQHLSTEELMGLAGGGGFTFE